MLLIDDKFLVIDVLVGKITHASKAKELVAPEGLACFAHWGIFHGNADFFCNIIVVHSLDLLKKCGTHYQEK